MATIDTIKKHGDVLRIGVVGKDGNQKLNRETLSPRYTTDWEQFSVNG
jgi:hypothetical protein